MMIPERVGAGVLTCPAELCKSESRREGTAPTALPFALFEGWQSPQPHPNCLAQAQSYFAASNSVHGNESISRRTSFSQSNSGCFCTCGAALKSIPQACPADATNCIFAAIVAVVALF